MTNSIPAAVYQARLDAAQAQARAQGARALLIGVGPELAWLTGYHAPALERLTMLVVPDHGASFLVAPRLEVSAAGVAPAVSGGVVAVRAWQETDDPVDLVWEGVPGTGAESRLLVSDTLRASFLLRLQVAFPGASFGTAGPVMGPLRRKKDAAEIELLRRAAHAADRAVLAIARGRLVGRSEAEVAAEVNARLVDEGHDTAQFAIVASGSNSASPHHGASDRVIAAGEPIVLDIGGSIEGYQSDVTRTVWVTGGDSTVGPDDIYRTIHGLVRRANMAGRTAVRPHVPAQDLDRAARLVIDTGGYGAAFFHRLGHGIGLEGHEDPYIVEGNTAPLEVGDAFSIEPGIYLEGRYGVRIEDIVVCDETGPDDLNRATRELLVVSGL